MTELEKRIKALAEKWRGYAAERKGSLKFIDRGYADAMEDCYMELESLLSPAPSADTSSRRLDNPMSVITDPPELAPSADAGTGWQSIETAPKDGTWVLAGAADWALPEMVQWFKRTETSGVYWQSMDSGPFEPTHWMPLPASPSGTDANTL